MKQSTSLKNILLSALILLFTGCMQVAFLAYDVHKPRPVSISKMQKKYTKLGYTHLPIFTFKDSTNYFEFLISQKPGINEVFIFNQEGFLVIPKTKMTCSSDNKDYLSNFTLPVSMTVDSTFP
jgi:hypothetical protein